MITKKLANGLPVFLQDPKIREILDGVKNSVPNGSKAYLDGGALRNAVYSC